LELIDFVLTSYKVKICKVVPLRLEKTKES